MKDSNPKVGSTFIGITFAIKKIEYDLIAASDKQKTRSKSLLGTINNHKLIISYMEYQGKMYPNYYYYEDSKTR